MSTGTLFSAPTDRRGVARIRSRAALAATIGLLAALTAPATSASAHDTLSSADPAAGTTVTEPLDTIALTFTEDLLVLGEEANGFAIQVLSADGNHLASGCVDVAGPVAETSVALPSDGEYAVRWQVVSSDGHPISGEYSFAYATGETLDVPALADPPVCGAAWAGSEPEPEMTTMTEAPAESPEPSASAPAAGEDAETGSGANENAASGGDQTDPASDDTDIPLGGIVIGTLAIIGAAALVILMARRRSRDLP
ncbi:copper resistance CopC family protein [Planctomonas psychrotolerans]|uniref:copper resistance CopC family protein n=1 Tax=Planctomonas psychrotolerans TaxID=2528712 RepID=UPI001D0D3FF5|nr:copper resistance CopC family protein [Planctomonas psychrotolerans]